MIHDLGILPTEGEREKGEVCERQRQRGRMREKGSGREEDRDRLISSDADSQAVTSVLRRRPVCEYSSSSIRGL